MAKTVIRYVSPMASLDAAVERSRLRMAERDAIKAGIVEAKRSGMKVTISAQADNIARTYSRAGFTLTNEHRKALAARCDLDPLVYWTSVLNDQGATFDERHLAATSLAPYLHAKLPTKIETSNLNVGIGATAAHLATMPADQLETLHRLLQPAGDVVGEEPRDVTPDA